MLRLSDKRRSDMLSIIFFVALVWVMWKLFVFAMKAAWGIVKIFCTVLLFPALLVGLVCVGLLYVAILILVITGAAVLIGEAVKA